MDYYVKLLQRVESKKASIDDLQLLSKLSTRQINAAIDAMRKEYMYLVTFTIDTKKYTEKNYDEIKKYIIKQFQRKPLQVTKAQIVQEGNGKDKHIHWHVAVHTMTPLKKDRFHYYIKKYGNIDISKSKSNSYDELQNYISKEVVPIDIV